MASTEVNNVDHRAPDVRHLVYSMYRKMLTGYNDQANEIVDALPREIVQEDANIYRHLEEVLKQQASVPQSGDMSSQGGQVPPPPPPLLSGAIPGRRLKTEMPERSLEPPSVIQNAMMTKDKKPFTYTPGGIDLSQIRSPRMQRRIHRNACAEEMPGIPAPTTNHHANPPADPAAANTNYSAMQSQLPSQVLPPVGAMAGPGAGAGAGAPPPPPPPPPPGPGTTSAPHPVVPHAPAANGPSPKPTPHRPPVSFDPNELLARVPKVPPHEPSPALTAQRDPPGKVTVGKPVEEKPQSKSNDFGQNVYSPVQTEPGRVYVPPVQPETRKETVVSQPQPHRQVGSIYVPPVHTNQESTSPSPGATMHQNTTPFGYKPQPSSVPAPAAVTTPPASNVETKPQAPWVTMYRTQPSQPQPSSVPWANREPESPKYGGPGTRIIPIQIEGRDSPKSPSPSYQPQPTPPPFLQSPQMRAQQQQQQQQQQMRQQQATTQPLHQQQQQSQMRQQSTIEQQSWQQQQQQHQQTSNTRIIPIQIEGDSPRSPVGAGPTNKFGPMTPQSPYSPSSDSESSKWPKPFGQRQPVAANSEVPPWRQQQHQTPQPQQQQQQHQPQQQPEYGTYNTAGVPVSQLRKMQLSDDDRALMDKFKTQVEMHGNDILNDENTNPRYRGGYIPSRVFKVLDESVDDEQYLHGESDPRYRGAVIPSRAFRMLQCMTNTAGNVHQQVPRSPPQTGDCNRSVGETGHHQEPIQQGPYVPPSEQQVQEPRKYTGGSIPSRSFRMLQAMTGQEMSAQPGSASGRETPVYGMNGRWCPSPSPCPSPVDPVGWGGYFPADPYLMYNYITELHAVCGLPPPPPPSPFMHTRSSPYRSYSVSDNEEQGYSSTDELAQYYTNYRRNFGRSPFSSNPDRSYGASTPSSFKIPRVYVTPVGKRGGNDRATQVQAQAQTQVANGGIECEVRGHNGIRRDEVDDEEDDDDDDEEDDDGSETEVDDDDDNEGNRRTEEVDATTKANSLLALKSVSNINIYTSESSSTIVQDRDEGDVEEPEDEDVSTSESFEESEPQEPISHQLSVIFEESEQSEMESTRRGAVGETQTESDSETCSTLDNGDEEEVEEDNSYDDEDDLEIESSVTVRLPLRVKFSRSKDDEEVTMVIVGDSVVERDVPTTKHQSDTDVTDICDDGQEGNESDSGDISVTFTVPSRSNSIKSVDPTTETCVRENREASEDREVHSEMTVRLPRLRVSEEPETVPPKAEICESPHTEDDSSSTTVQSGKTLLNDREDTDDDEDNNDDDDDEDKDENFDAEPEGKDWSEIRETEACSGSYRDGVGRLEEMISSMLQSTRDSMTRSVELSQSDLDDDAASAEVAALATAAAEPSDTDATNGKLRKKDSQEESEEDDSGVTSDMSVKQMNSETDADTESDYSELSKMTKFQRASTHSRLFKLLQEECEKSDEDNDVAAAAAATATTAPEYLSLSSRKEKLTLPLLTDTLDPDSLSSNSDIASLSSPTVSDRLVSELVHSLLNKKKGKRFRSLPLAKLHAAAQKILQEELDAFDTSPTTSCDDGYVRSPSARSRSSPHSRLACQTPCPFEDSYGTNYNDYLDYYNTWGVSDVYRSDDYDIVPSKTFRLLREQTNSPVPVEGFGRARCPRVTSRKNLAPTPTPDRATPAPVPAPASVSAPATPYPYEPDSERYLTFAEKQERVAKVLKKSVAC